MKQTPRLLSTPKSLPDLELAKIGIVTAIPKEYAAVRALLIKPKKVEFIGDGAGYRYTIGDVASRDGGKHCVVLAMAAVGNNLASARVTQLLGHFSDIDFVIMVGIAGGVPYPSKPEEHVRLGDILISNEQGVIHYEFKTETFSEIIPRFPPRPPSALLLDGVRLLSASTIAGKQPWVKLIEKALKKLNVKRPPENTDILTSAEEPLKVIPHPYKLKRIQGQPRVFTGPIASDDILLKNPHKRDQLRDEFGVKAVEMEGSGIADATWNLNKGYLIVRGISDYCDSKKSDEWQQYAAIVAAAYTYALIESLPSKSHLENTSHGKFSEEKTRNKVREIIGQQEKAKLINRRYRNDGVLGQGNFAIVYKAYDTHINSYVALKQFKIANYSETDDEERSFQRFHREAIALANLTHPNIARILNSGKIGKKPYIVLPYFSGGTIQSRVTFPTSYLFAASLLVPITHALSYAHKENFIHRDIKPSNILLTENGIPILSDFGMVKCLKDIALTQTIEGKFVGTILYAAPEQLEGNASYQSDIYSLGIVFYEMITGHIPFEDNWPRKFSLPFPEHPSYYDRNIPDAVDQIVLRATARDLKDRYADIDSFGNDLYELTVKHVPPPQFPPSDLGENSRKTPLHLIEHTTAEELPIVQLPSPTSLPPKLVEDFKKGEIHLLEYADAEELPSEKRLSSLLKGLEQEYNNLVAQNDIRNAKRLLKVIERFGTEGQRVANNLESILKT